MMLQFASAFNLKDLFQSLKDFGVYEYLLPFVLVVAIVFAVLEKTNIFGEGKTNINAVISFVIGLLLVAQQGIVEIINLFLPRVSLIIVVILMILVVLTMLGGKAFPGLQGGFLTVAVIVAIIAVILALSPNIGFNFDWVTPYDRARLWTIGIIVGVFILLFMVFKGKSNSGSDGAADKFFKNIQKSIRGD